ncbi:hypothetical protein [Burkholderia plantarii]|uniref:hypothetical protein n=1 Tax=Burkholderia plantarii TaxID=41899 RepID=UPI000870AD42|nr:hypothetical protein [Burkholderia plantarii]
MAPIRSPSPSTPSITTPSTPASPGTTDGADARTGRGLPAAQQSGPAQLAGLRSRPPSPVRGEGGAEAARTGRGRAASQDVATPAPARSTDPAESARIVAAAETITTLPALQAALGELGGLDPSLHAKPLGALANRIETLPPEDRAAAFQAVSKAVGELPPAAQAHPLARLGFQACELPEADRARAFQNTFASMEHVVSSGQATPGEHAQMLAGLAYSVPGLTPGQQQAEVGRLMTQIGKLPQGSRGAPISSLAYRLDVADPGVRQAAFDGAIAHLEPGGGGKAELTALAAAVHQLPDPGERQKAFDELLPRIDKLAGPDRGEAVQNLTMQIVDLPPQNMLSAVNTMLGVVGEPGEDPHLQMAQQLLNHFKNLLSQAVDA